jgi:DNA polymerase-3 subunit gamma/tau
MLGLADRGRVLDLIDMILRGDAAGALVELSAQYSDGADPMAVLRDLAEITHWVSVIKITPEAAEDPTISPDERSRGLDMADKLPMRVMTRMWQMLLKAIEEVSIAPNAMMAAEMAIIRLTHVADAPTPGDLVTKLKDATPPPAGPGGGGGGVRHAPTGGATAYSSTPAPTHSGPSGPVAQAAPVLAENALARYARFQDVLDLISAHRDVKLLVEVENGVRLARYQPGRIEFEPSLEASPDLASKLGARLQAWTGNRWAVILVNEGGKPTVAEVRDAEINARKAEAATNPLVQAVLATFPKSKITEVRTAADLAQEALVEGLQEVEDEWDPFEEG